MTLTDAQLDTLKAWLTANANGLQDEPAAALLNAVRSPDFWVWRTSVPKNEIVTQTSQDGTTFTWAGNGFITRSVGELECWNQLFNSTLTTNPSLANVRQAFSDIFSGTGNAASNRAHLLAVARRKATVGEHLFATGTGTTGSPGLMGPEGVVTVANVSAARNRP
jgi:hypothetical protein